MPRRPSNVRRRLRRQRALIDGIYADGATTSVRNREREAEARAERKREWRGYV